MSDIIDRAKTIAEELLGSNCAETSCEFCEKVQNVLPELIAECERLEKSKNDWEEEACRLGKNSDYWSEKYIAIQTEMRGCRRSHAKWRKIAIEERAKKIYWDRYPTASEWDHQKEKCREQAERELIEAMRK